MLLKSAQVQKFKSIDGPQTVSIDPSVTVLVGMNESGKTVFLQALQKTRDASGIAKFSPVDDYPRKDLSSYLKSHPTSPADTVILTYELSPLEVRQLNKKFQTTVAEGFRFAVTHRMDNFQLIDIQIDEKPVVSALLSNAPLGTDAKAAVSDKSSLRDVVLALEGIELTEAEKGFLEQVSARVTACTWKGNDVIGWEVFQWLKPKIPHFLYFSDYDLLPSKVSLSDLAARVEQAKKNPERLNAEHRAVLALMRMADIEVTDLGQAGGYEQLKSRIEAVNIKLTDQIMEFWKQNEDLDVEVDIRPDPKDDAPFNTGENLYLRIKNRRHRGVSTPFQQRSRGFIWFFSFLVWFDSVKDQLGADGDKVTDTILLLDEPGLALHALAQSDFLKYIDDLATRHQVLYTTHSPFMVHSDRLHQVRVVEDQKGVGTVISDNLQGSDPKAIFPLQAALGWTVAQNLFISERNLLVEGPSDLIFLKLVSSLLETNGRTSFRDDVTIVPVGGLDKVVTFVSLLGASNLKLVVLHDYRGNPEQSLTELVRQKIVPAKQVQNVSRFRDLSNLGVDGKASDVEDLFTVTEYLAWFNAAYAKKLPTVVTEADLPPGDRIIDRIERYLAAQNIVLRPSGGFNHYLVASHVASSPPAKISADAMDRFEALFKSVNGLF